MSSGGIFCERPASPAPEGWRFGCRCKWGRMQSQLALHRKCQPVGVRWMRLFAIFFDAGRNLHAGAPQMKGLHPDPASESRKGKSQCCSVVQGFPLTAAGSSQRGNEPPRRSPSESGCAGPNTGLSLQYQSRCSCQALIMLFLFSSASSSARARSRTLNPCDSRSSTRSSTSKIASAPAFRTCT